MRTIAVVLFGASIVLSLRAQQTSNSPNKPALPSIAPHLVLMTDSVVDDQWPHTLKLVNAPEDVTLVTPGECIRVGIVATGDDRDAYLEKTKLLFQVKFAGKAQAQAAAPLAAIKQIKPQGGDFVTAALSAANIKNPLLSLASLGASAEKWCVPADAQDGTATVQAEAESPDGRKKLPAAKVRVESFATGSQRAFKDGNELSKFLMVYYREPEATRLVPVLEYFERDRKINSAPGTFASVAEFLSAALKADPVAAKHFKARMAVEPPKMRALGLAILRSAGYDIGGAAGKLSADDRQILNGVTPLPDLFALPLTQENATYLDMMWAVFGATGNLEPMSKIAGTLNWRADYEAFEKMRESGRRLTKSDLTPSVMRGLTYMAAGWSMSSFQVDDPLAADYIEYMLASPDVPEAVKTELKVLQTNPAFHEMGGHAK